MLLSIMNIVHIIIGKKKKKKRRNIYCIRKLIVDISGFDIGNHFCEYMFDYVSLKEWPFFTVDFHRYPNMKQQVSFFFSIELFSSLIQTINNYFRLTFYYHTLMTLLMLKMNLFIV